MFLKYEKYTFKSTRELLFCGMEDIHAKLQIGLFHVRIIIMVKITVHYSKENIGI